MSFSAHQHSRLIHQTAWHPGIVVLSLLAELGELQRGSFPSEKLTQYPRHNGLQRSAATESAAERNGGRNR